MLHIARRWLDLDNPAPQRLEALHEAFGSNWRDERNGCYRLDNWQRCCSTLDQGKQDGRHIWYTHQGPEFRGECFADEVHYEHERRGPIDHHGWYTDSEFQDETIRGIVARLPHGRFICGYYVSMNGERVYYPEVFEDQIEAARAADHYAEHVAEAEREYQDRWRAARDLEEKIADKMTRLQECRALHRCGLVSKDTPHDYLDEARDCIASIRKLRDELSQPQFAEVRDA